MKENNTGNINVINIMYGLPGSGKTYYCSSAVRDDKKAVCIHMDEAFRKWQTRRLKRIQELEDWLPDEINNCIMCWPEAETLYLDGLCTTHEVLKKMIKCVSSAVKGKCIITVHVWDENRELCMVNDGGRGRGSALMSIKNLPYDALKTKEDVTAAAGYVKNFTYNIHMHKVIEKPEWKQMFPTAREDLISFSSYSTKRSDYKIFSDSEKWYSARWCLGGKSVSYTGVSYIIDAGEDTEINDVMDFLESVYSRLTLHDFRKIMDECVTIEKEEESDYYGGTVVYARYAVNLPGVYGIISDGNTEKK